MEAKEFESTTWRVNRVARVRKPAASFFFFFSVLSKFEPATGRLDGRRAVMRQRVLIPALRLETRRAAARHAWPMGPQTPDSS
jgi:hypothetical protein